MSDTAYLKYLEMQKDGFNINEVLLKLVEWNADFSKTEFFRTKKSKDISRLKEDFCEGRLPQVGDNLTIMDKLTEVNYPSGMPSTGNFPIYFDALILQ